MAAPPPPPRPPRAPGLPPGLPPGRPPCPPPPSGRGAPACACSVDGFPQPVIATEATSRTVKRRNLRMSLPSLKMARSAVPAPRRMDEKTPTGGAFRELRHSLRPRLTDFDLAFGPGV